MKNVSTWSIVGLFAGLIFATGSFVRYYILYPDMDKALVYIIIGGMMAAFAWVYHRLVEITNTLNAIEDYLDERRVIVNNE